MGTARWRTPLAVAAVLVVAEAGVLLLWPRDGVIEPAPVEETSFFTPAQLERAQDFRGPQRIIGLVILGVEGAILVWLVARPPRALRRRFGRPLLAAAGAGAALSVVLQVAPLPLRAVARQRAVDVGLSTQSWPEWAVDLAKASGIGAVFAGAGAAAGVALMRRFPRRWWLPAAGLVVAFGVATTYASPIVLDPLFNRFTPLEGRTRADVLELARRAGVDVGQVYEVDASRRTTGANAYVAGLGRTKRVVLYDNLLEGFERDEVRLVVAHELAHVHYRDVPNGLLYLAIVAPAGMFAAATLTRRLAPADEGERPGPAVLPAVALSIFVLSTAIMTISNQLSRRVEARADSYALQLTRAPEPFIDFEKRITLRNVSEPDPPRWSSLLFGTHPAPIERIGAGVAFRETARRGDRRTPGGS